MLFEGNPGGSEEYVLISRVTFIVADIVRFYDVSPTLIFKFLFILGQRVGKICHLQEIILVNICFLQFSVFYLVDIFS